MSVRRRPAPPRSGAPTGALTRRAYMKRRAFPRANLWNWTDEDAAKGATPPTGRRLSSSLRRPRTRKQKTQKPLFIRSANPSPVAAAKAEEVHITEDELLEQLQDSDSDLSEPEDSWQVEKIEDVFSENTGPDDDFIDTFQEMGPARQQKFFELLAPQRLPGRVSICSTTGEPFKRRSSKGTQPFVPSKTRDMPGTAGGQFVTACRETSNIMFPIRKEAGQDVKRRVRMRQKVQEMHTKEVPNHSRIIYPWTKLSSNQNTHGRLRHMDYSNYGLGEKGVSALAAYLRSTPIKLGSLILRSNRMRGDSSVVLMNAIKSNPSLAHLDLSHNRMHARAAATLSACLATSLPPLVDLDLQDMRLGDALARTLMRGLSGSGKRANKSVQRLVLRGNCLMGCGREVGDMLRNNTMLRHLDLSWNRLSGASAVEVAAPIRENSTLRVLLLRHNAFGHGSGAQELATALKPAFNNTLELLDLSYNHIAEDSCLVLTHALTHNDSLKKLQLDGNPIGHLGCRSLLAVMTIGDSDEPRDISFLACNVEINNPKCFDEDEPNGEYALRLDQPYGHMVMERLCECSMRQWESFKGITLSGKAVKQDELSAWLADPERALPQEGVVRFSFIRLSSRKKIDEPARIEKFKKVLKRRGSRSHFGSEQLQAKLINSATDIFTFQADDAGKMINQFQDLGRKVESAVEMYLDQVDTHKTEAVFKHLSYIERKMVETQLGTFYHYNSRNPTGHYKLSLSTRLERLLALRIIEANGDERHFNMLQNGPDKSQWGNRQNLRNCKFNGEDFIYQGDWELPVDGILEFDYVSTKRPPHDAHALSAPEMYGKGYEHQADGSVTFGDGGFWQTYVRPTFTKEAASQVHEAFEIADSDGSGQCSVDELKDILHSTGVQLTPAEVDDFVLRADESGDGEINLEEFLPLYKELVMDLQMKGRLKTLRRVSSHFYFTAKQGAEMLQDFEHSYQRVELFAILFARIEDEENLDRMLGVLTNAEKLQLDHQLGSLSLFNPLKPDGFYGNLNLQHNDSYVVAHSLIKLAVVEPGDNWLGETLDELKGRGPQEFDLNLNWVKNGPPRSGILSLTYYTPPGCARPEARIEIAEDFCGWEFAVEDDPDNPMSPRSRRKSMLIALGLASNSDDDDEGFRTSSKAADSIPDPPEN